MSSPQWQQASDIVQAALKRPPAERATFINTVCYGNEPLLQEVEILLRYYSTTESTPAPPPPTPTTGPLEQWWQPARQSNPLSEPPDERATGKLLNDSSARTPSFAPNAADTIQTTEEIPVPEFHDAEVVSIPPSRPTRDLVSELAQGYEKLPAEPSPFNAPSAKIPPAASAFDQTSQRLSAPPTPSSGESRPPVSFDAPTVRPVFEQPAGGSGVSQPTYRPIFEKPPKPPEPPYDPAKMPSLVDFPSLQAPPNSVPPATGRFDQTSQRPNFNQPSQPGSFEQRSQRANFDQPSVRGVAGQAPPTGQFSGGFGGRTAAGAAPAPAPGEPRPVDGRMLAHYQLLHEIGRGGMGRVYLAQDTRLGRRVALKLLLRHSTRDPEKVRRFQQEARAASALNHPNILTIHEIGEVKGVHYLATEYVEGRTLRALIDRGRFKISVALEIAIQIASALESAHRANIVHRDIKPENLMLRTDGYVKVLDFGIAKLVDAPSGEGEPNGSGTLPPPEAFETKPGVLIGTASYMSPEQARGMRVDRRTDVFSLGIVLYEMITGQSPFKGATNSDTLAALLSHTPTPLSRHLSTAPLPVLQGLQRILSRALEKDREQRYQSARDFVTDLKALKQSLEQKLPPEPPPHTTGALPPAQNLLSVESPAVAETPAPAPLPVRDDNGEILIELDDPPEPVVNHAALTTTQSGKRTGSVLRGWGWFVFYLLVGLGMAGLSYWLYGYILKAQQPGASIAVLPFEYTKASRAGDEERDYLADGLTESLIQRLSQVPQLKVIARNSVFRYKGKTPDPHEVGQALNVRTVLTGRITPRQNQWTITIELVDANNSAVLWGQQYDSPLTDLHLLHNSLANRIAEQLKLRLSGADQQRLAHHDTENVEAYKLYLKGRHLWNQRTGDAIKRSIENFQRAVLLDPNYARAYAALAESYVLAPIYSETVPEQAVSAGKDAAARALELDPNLAEPHAALGFIRYQYEWDWTGAEQAYERALTLNENYATAHQWYSSLLSTLGRTKEALKQAERARELDPVSTPISTNLGAALYYARRYPEAALQFDRALELNPNSPGVHAHLGMAYEQMEKPEQALASYQRALIISNESPQMRMRYCHALVTANRHAEARRLLDELQYNAPPGTLPLYQIAGIYAGLGERELALRTLAQAVSLREEGIVWLRVDPQLDSLRSDPAFAALLKSVGLPQ